MAITIDGTGSISGLSATGISAQPVFPGNILQVVNATYSTLVSVTTASYTDTGLTASITPSSASNKILILINQPYEASRASDNAYGGIRLLRDSTVINTPVGDSIPYELGIGVVGVTTIYVYGRYSIHMLDSPATTSSVTYKTQCRPYSTANSGRFDVQNDSKTSYITLLEVAA